MLWEFLLGLNYIAVENKVRRILQRGYYGKEKLARMEAIRKITCP